MTRVHTWEIDGGEADALGRLRAALPAGRRGPVMLRVRGRRFTLRFNASFRDPPGRNPYAPVFRGRLVPAATPGRTRVRGRFATGRLGVAFIGVTIALVSLLGLVAVALELRGADIGPQAVLVPGLMIALALFTLRVGRRLGRPEREVIARVLGEAFGRETTGP